MQGEPSQPAQASLEANGRLFMVLAEELKLPLQQIARAAELGRIRNEAGPELLTSMQVSADTALQLLDGYLLSLQLLARPADALLLEPVSVAAVLHETAEQLGTIAREYSVQLELVVEGRYEPVLAHRHVLECALLALGHALIEALSATGARQLRLQLASHRTRYGIVAGLYGEFAGLTPRLLRQARYLQGVARQPLADALLGSGAGVFVADALLGAMSSQLRVGRFQKMPGFAVTLPASEQLQLV